MKKSLHRKPDPNRKGDLSKRLLLVFYLGLKFLSVLYMSVCGLDFNFSGRKLILQ